MIVGPSSRNYRLHKKLLCHHSTFFDAAFNGDFQEGVSGQLKLPEEEAGAFDIFVHWLYKGSLPRVQYSTTPFSQPSKYLLVYAMGEKWFIPLRQDNVFDQLRCCWWIFYTCQSRSFVKTLYEATSPGCKLRQYFVKPFIFNALQTNNLATAEETLEGNGELAIDVAEEMFRKLSLTPGSDLHFPDTERLPLCEFHVHRPGIDCTQTGR